MLVKNPSSSLFFVFFLLAASFHTLSAQVNPDSVTIVRDHYGVPHIYGHTDADVAYGLAWAHSEDNFRDIQLNLLMGRARLGEVEGKEGAMIDYVVQLFDIRNIVLSKYDEEVSPRFDSILKAYCQGINAYIKRYPEELLRPGLGPVEPVDVLCGYTLSLVLLQGVSFDMINVLEGNPGGPTPMSPGGSNGIAMNSRITADGQVYLANNSHQPLSGRVAWYEAHLVSDEGLNILGGLFPGGVSVFAGANENLAWAHTVSLPDLTDVYELTTRKNGKQLEYKLDDQWFPLKTKKASMKVKVGGVMLTVKKDAFSSVHGPVIESKNGKFYAIRFPALMSVKAAEQWHTMNKARNYTEFRNALDMRGLPSLNIVYGDRHDTLFYISNGSFPQRQPGYDYRKILPGDRSEAIWEEFKPLSENVQVLCPSSGYIFNNNNQPFNCTRPEENPDPTAFDTLLCEYQFENNRSLRFQELMAGREKVDWETFKQIKFDRSYPDSMFVMFLDKPEFAKHLDGDQYPDIASEIRRMQSWDKEGDAEDPTAALYVLAIHKLMEDATKEGTIFQFNEISDDTYADALRYAKRHLKKHFGSTEVPLGEFQRHVRGEKDWPIAGLPDVLAAIHTKPWKNGRYQSEWGESYIQLVRFSEKEGVIMETVAPYGASEKPESPHYDDQVELYLAQKTKPMRLDREWVFAQGKRVYHPGK